MTKSADLSETRADRTGLCRRPGRRHGSLTKSGRVRVVEFGLDTAWILTTFLRVEQSSSVASSTTVAIGYCGWSDDFATETLLLICVNCVMLCTVRHHWSGRFIRWRAEDAVYRMNNYTTVQNHLLINALLIH